MIHQKYAEHLNQSKLKKKKQREASKNEKNQKQEYPRPPDGISPMKLGLQRISAQSAVKLTQQVWPEFFSSWNCLLPSDHTPKTFFPFNKQVLIMSGSNWLGSQSDVVGEKVQGGLPKDGADPRKLVTVKWVESSQ
jgi:hypothetical protein